MISASIGELLDYCYQQFAQEMLQFVTQTMPHLRSDASSQALSSLDYEFPNVAAALDSLDAQPEIACI